MRIASILAMMSMGVLAMASENENEIKIGTAPLSVTIECPDTTAISNASIWVQTAPLFMDMYENPTYKLERQGNTWSLDVPVELTEDIVGISFDFGDMGFGTLATVRQNESTELTFTLDDNLGYVQFKSNRADALDPLQWNSLSTAYLTFLESVDIVPDSLYSSWQQVRDYENNVIWPQMLASALEAGGLENAPDWFTNSLKCRFASIQTIPYVKVAERMNGIAVDEPPMEAYSFLDTIDYSPILLKRLPYTGMKSMIYALLRFPEGGFDRIGDTTLAEWQQKAYDKLLPAISNPSKLLLDLLAAMSYIQQVEIEQTPLTETQIENITRGFNDDLGKIVLAKNDRVAALKAKVPTIQDLTGTSFDLKKYIDKTYPRQPVIVDTWNTWCAPCLDAIGITEIIRNDMPETDIVFLYVADESSDSQKWHDIASNINGDQVRISKEDSAALGEQFSLKGFPSYLIFDRNHNLIKTETGFPGEEVYISWINGLAFSE